MSDNLRETQVNLLLAYNGTPRHRLFEYPHRDAGSRDLIRKAEATLDAILAANPGPDTVTEWGTGEGSERMSWRDREQAYRQSASATKSSDGGKTWHNTNPPVVSREVTPWKPVEA